MFMFIMTLKMKVSMIISGLLLILLHMASVSAISVIHSPSSESVFENGNVEFQCQMRDAEGYVLVWIATPANKPMHWIPAQRTGLIQLQQQEGHGDYSTIYSEFTDGGNVVNNLTLKIDSVQDADEGTYACGYRETSPSMSRLSPVGNSATLTILIPPREPNPRCSYSPNPLSLTTGSVIVTLICEMAGGSPPPDLTWYKEGSSTMSVSPTTSTTNTFAYTITGNDNGIQFTCVANGPALRQDGICSITPLLVDPSVSISSSADPVVENSDIIFTCEGSGLPYISKTEWLYNGQVLTDNTLPPGFQIVKISDDTSELHVFSIQLDNNSDIVTCYVETPSGQNNRESTTISVIRSPIKPTTISVTRSAIKPTTTMTTINMLNGIPTLFTASVSARTISTEIIRGPEATTSGGNGSAHYISTETIKTPVAVIGVSIYIAAAGGGVIFILLIVVLFIVLWKCRQNSTKRNPDNTRAQILLDGQRDNPREPSYEMHIASDDELRTTPYEQPAESGYVINHISGMNSLGEQTGSETMGSDHPGDHSYDHVNFGSRQYAVRTPANVANPAHASNHGPTSPYATSIFGNADPHTYGKLDLSNTRSHGYPQIYSEEYAIVWT
ncbi:uncharacterized protein [Amphiura filiformis]|uniref:uncharacterized protein n=1 Tax=Amphiura filiformis TaxID=82378 RepID=UPI003B21EE4C